MFNPIEMFQPQGGAEMQAMAQQFGLSPEQTARALEALMPALTLGIQRGAGLDPIGFARMLGMPDAGRSPAPQGLDALGQMFGSAQLMQAVLQQASNASGVGSQVLRQMLPMMAGAVVASIVHVMLNQPTPEPARKAPAPASPQPSAFPFGTVWADMARAFLPAGAPPRPVQTAPSRATAPQTEPPDPKAESAGPDMFQQMVRTGAEVQSQNIKAMQDLFETFWPKPSAEAEGGSGPPAAEPAATPDAPTTGRVGTRSTPKPRRGGASED